MDNLQQQLTAFSAEAGFGFYYFEQTTSTNDLARGAEYVGGDLIVAERQSAGRGQRGNRWSSCSGENLTFSVVLTPDFVKVESQFYISKVVALAVADTVAVYADGEGVRIKWPNDIYVGHRKIAGILIENDIMGEYISRSVAGIGLNVNQIRFDPVLPNPVSLALLSDEKKKDRSEVLITFYKNLSQRYEQLADGFSERLDRDYLALLFRRDEWAPFVECATGERFMGCIRTVLPAGGLIVVREDGSQHEFLFKEIEFIHAL